MLHIQVKKQCPEQTHTPVASSSLHNQCVQWGNDCLFNKEQKWRHRCREQRRDCYGAGDGAWEIGIDIYVIVILCLEYVTSENCCAAQGTLGNALR